MFTEVVYLMIAGLHLDANRVTQFLNKLLMFVGFNMYKTVHFVIQISGQEPFSQLWINFNPVRITNYAYCEVWCEITYPFPNFNGAAVEVWD